MSTREAVAVRSVVKRFGAITALDGLSFGVPEAAMTALVGPDGAGKTTTLRLLCGLAVPESGEVEVLGLGWSRERARLKRSIGYLPQRFSLYGDLSVDENIEFFAELHGIRGFRPRRDELLAFTRLEPFRRRPAEQLSGGMKQKLALACTLIHEPRVLFLDEPTTGVDPVSRRDFWMLLSGVLKRGVTVLMATPYMDEAERCDRVVLLDRGRRLVMGSPAELRAELRAALYEVSGVDVRRSAAALRGEPWVEELEAFGDRLHVASRDPEARRRIEDALAALAPPGPRVRAVEPGIEDVFVHFLKGAGS